MRSKVLIVDDNIFNIVTLKTIIESNFKVKCDKAMNGLEALEKVRTREIDRQNLKCVCGQEKGNYQIIFMDCNMPIMDGFESS